jgi:hypothetical protein
LERYETSGKSERPLADPYAKNATMRSDVAESLQALV